MAEWLPFRLTLETTLDGSGNGTIRFSPSIGTHIVEQVAASVATAVNEPEFQAHINGSFVGGSYSGSRTNDTNFNQRLAAQEVLNGTWIGGDPGAIATMVLTGRKQA